MQKSDILPNYTGTKLNTRHTRGIYEKVIKPSDMLMMVVFTEKCSFVRIKLNVNLFKRMFKVHIES